MKKLYMIGLVGFALLSVSCVTTPSGPPPKITSTVASEKNSGLVEIVVEAGWQNSFLYPAGFSGFSVSIKNNTDKVIRVVWDRSSLSYNGGSYTPFLSGQKYIDASNPMSPSVVPAKGQILKDVFSSAQPYYSSGRYGGWSMTPIVAKKVLLVICVQSGDVEDNYTVDVSQEAVAPAE